MLSVAEARERALAEFAPLPSERVPVQQARGRVLARGADALEDNPPFDNSAMDGYAVLAADIVNASPDSPVSLRVIDNIPAGKAPTVPIERGCAARIMTGAMTPPGADAVVMIEMTETDGEKVRIMQASEAGRHIRRKGESVRAGDRVLEAGTLIGSAECAMLAALNIAHAEVYRKPRAAVLSTGDELIDLGDPLTPGKIRDSNRYGIWAQIEEAGGTPIDLGIAGDDAEDVEKKIRAGMEKADLLITSGGVSVGDHDIVKEVLLRLGELHFWRVAMKPGKPQAFGRVLGKPVFALPGNPVSSMVVFELFARPALLKMGGLRRLHRRTVRAAISQSVRPDASGRVNYMRVALTETDGGLRADLTGAQGSGILRSLIGANGLAVVDKGGVNAGEELDVLRIGKIKDEI